MRSKTSTVRFAAQIGAAPSTAAAGAGAAQGDVVLGDLEPGLV
jgi:hypothetical protein